MNMKLFKKREKREPPPVQELPRSRDELLLGDDDRTWTINDFVIHPKLTGLYEEIDRSLQRIFEKGSLDAANGNLFDGSIDAASVIAQNALEQQNDLRPEGIYKMLAWRERDVSELQYQLKIRRDNIARAQNELEHYRERLDSLNLKRKALKYDEKKNIEG